MQHAITYIACRRCAHPPLCCPAPSVILCFALAPAVQAGAGQLSDFRLHLFHSSGTLSEKKSRKLRDEVPTVTCLPPLSPAPVKVVRSISFVRSVASSMLYYFLAVALASWGNHGHLAQLPDCDGVVDTTGE